ncbi:hypothetical protein [Flavobacterium sp. NRK F7]|uniref:hypothetical protein n=1 Tax=Flavobacterium sp. NRK F7 TaxID=2954930 RepID=UPI0020917D10|nr:hypothetical protein [Flavobacterium sp. NRK F7]MCO6163866.1 hypothetical protein [Flavobacterium sp. NRK F7]
MSLQKILLKFLLIFISFELLLDILKLIIPATILELEFSYILLLVRLILFIFLLKELYLTKVKYSFVLLVVLMYPILIQFIQFGLGSIFIHFCSQETNNANENGLINLVNQMTNCPFPTTLNFYYLFEAPIYCIKDFFENYTFSSLSGFIFSPYIISFIVFFKFSLFMIFKENHKNPYLSLLPVIDFIIILRICKLPIYWIFILMIPILRLFWFYQINKELCQIQKVNASNSIWMTLLPTVFYGKLVYKH